jgi:hypothetical protein
MKKMISSAILIISFAGIVACKKNETPNSPGINKSHVLSWLNDQKIVAKSDSDKIDSIIKLLDFSRARPESLGKEKSFLVIPFQKRTAANERNADTPISILLIKQKKTGEVDDGYIVQYTGNEKSGLPVNCFSRIYNSNPGDIDGKFLFSSITQRPRFELRYKKGNMETYSIIRRKDSPGFASKLPQDPFSPAPANCVDWYWVTTTIYADGHTETTQRFAFTACEVSGGGGGNESECCVPDNDIALSSVQTDEDQHTNCVETKPDIKTRNPVRICTTDWIFYKNTWLWYRWNYRSYETSVAEQINGVWRFRPGSISHSGISMEGQLPPCVSFTCTITSAVGSISANGQMAYMDLTANSIFNVPCIKISSGNGSSVRGRTFWYA